MNNTTLELTDLDRPDMTSISVDFTSGGIAYRRKYGHNGGETISKAVGVKKGYRPKIVDATAGWGRDAFVLATLGCRVHMIERSKMIAKLLEDGLRRAKEDHKIRSIIKDNLSLSCGDSHQELLHLPFRPEVIYLDPMFPLREKSALVKKEMRALQEIVGSDTDSSSLLQLALTISTNRVVVKRPNYANFLASTQPNTSIKTKKHRFDIYLTSN